MFARGDSSVSHTGRFELPWTVAHCGKSHCLLDEPATEAVICSEKQGQNYQAEESKGSIKSFQVKDIHIAAKITPPPSPNVGLGY